MFLVKHRLVMSPAFMNKFGQFHEETIPAEDHIHGIMQDYETLYTKNRSQLTWVDGRKNLFEFGPYAYPRCPFILDSFPNHTVRRKYCDDIKKEDLRHLALQEYAKNKLFHERIEAIIRYAQYFLKDNEVVQPLLAEALKHYDMADHSPRIIFYERDYYGAEGKLGRIEVAEHVGILALAIVKEELKNLH